MQTLLTDGPSYCVYCMEEFEGNNTVCSCCGRPTQTVTQPLYCIRPHTLLQGKYLVGRMLGQGGFGITYIGRDRILNTKIAIKEYFPMSYVSRDNTLSNRLQWTDRLVRDRPWEEGCGNILKEARKMAKLKDIPGAVRVLDTFEENNTAYIVMDYVQGITLKQQIEQNCALSFQECISVLHPIMETLIRIHEHGIIHRDISPDNIILENGVRPRILDLGAAKEINILNHGTSQLVAKKGFSPLEQYTHDTDNSGSGPWTDVYAMCATIYYCVTGRIPPDSLERIRQDDLCLEPPEFSLAEAAILREGMALHVQERIQSMDELLSRLDAANPGWHTKKLVKNEETTLKPVGSTSAKTSLFQIFWGVAVGISILLISLYALLPSTSSTATDVSVPTVAVDIPFVEGNDLKIVIGGKTVSSDVTELDLRECGIKDIHALSRMTNLIALSLRSNQVSDISALKYLTNLTMLSLRSNQVKDLAALENLTNLRRLYLDDNQVTKIDNLASLTELIELDLSNNQICDISALSELTNLTVLYLNNNQISDISVLGRLTGLTDVVLTDNPIQTEQIAALQDELPNCRIVF